MMEDLVTKKETSSEIKYPIMGFAPGNYWCKCSTCHGEFSGDKRSAQCLHCAINLQNESHTLCLAHCQELIKENETLIKTIEILTNKKEKEKL